MSARCAKRTISGKAKGVNTEFKNVVSSRTISSASPAAPAVAAAAAAAPAAPAAPPAAAADDAIPDDACESIAWAT